MSDSNVTDPEDTKIPIYFLKTRSSPSDAYEDYFSNESHGQYQPVFVPVLEHCFNYRALQELQSLVISGAFRSRNVQVLPQTAYGGLIFTSQRAVNAFSKCVCDIRRIGAPIHDLLPPNLPLYVVGPATARGLKALNLKCSVLGEESGNGEALASLILKDASLVDQFGTSKRRLPLLFLVGEQRRHIIPKTLQADDLAAEYRIPIRELIVYETGEMEGFSKEFATLVKPKLEQGVTQWVVVFSPTGTKAMLEVLGLLDENKNRLLPTAVDTTRKTMIATIGPTTRAYLVEEYGFEPDVCASKPTPEGVAIGIQWFQNQRNSHYQQ